MAIKEPYVKVTEQIIDYPSVSNIDDSSLMAGVINAPCGPDHALIQGPRQFLDTFTVNGSIPRDADVTLINAYFCSFFAPILLKRVWNSDDNGKVPIIGGDLSTTGSGTADSTPVSINELPVTTTTNNVSMKYPVDTTDNTTASPVMELVVGAMTINNWINAKYSTTNSTYAELFNSNEFKSIDPSEESKYKLLVIYWYDEVAGIESSKNKGYRLVSLDMNGINPLTDSSVYWEDVLDSEIIPVVFNLSSLTWISNYKAEVKLSTNSVDDYNSYENATTDDYIAAFNLIPENSDIYNIAYIEDFGYVSGDYNKKLADAANINWWFYFWNVPYTSNTIDAISSVATSELDNYRFMVGGPFDWSSAVTPWRTYIAASSLYWQRVYNNKSSNSEFAPVFDITNGTLAYQKPVKELTKNDRETLLSATYPINWVKYDRTNQVYYLNDNRTHTRKQNVMNEEMNVRMMNKIARDIQLLLPRYKGMLNNEKTRLDCKGLLESYMNQSIMSQNYRPVEYLIVCDESNNTPAVINANKLAVTVYVRLQGSIKYIEVLNKIYPLGVAFES